MNHEPTHLDLFSGIGGFAIAAQWAGFRTVGFCEIDPYCQAILAERFGAVADTHHAGQQTERTCAKRNGERVEAELRSARLHPDIFTLRGTDYAGVSLITGGFPCQPFSCAGKRRGAADNRAIWPQMLRVIAEARPSWVLAENVPGIINMELDRVLSDLEGEGYTTGTLVIPACAVDARHRRDRVWIVANYEGRQSWQQKTRNWREGAGRTSEALGHSNERGVRRPRTQRIEGHAGQPSQTSPDTGRELLERWQRESEEGATERIAEPGLGGMVDGVSRWLYEPPDVPRTTQGTPNRAARLKSLGNAIVPQVAYQILRHIRKLL